jgi:hypothetical protein
MHLRPGAVNAELTIGSKTLPTTFFVIDGKGTYSLLLGGDWIHVNCYIPSTVHQCLIQWQGDNVIVVQANYWRSLPIKFDRQLRRKKRRNWQT